MTMLQSMSEKGALASENAQAEEATGEQLRETNVDKNDQDDEHNQNNQGKEDLDDSVQSTPAKSLD